MATTSAPEHDALRIAYRCTCSRAARRRVLPVFEPVEGARDGRSREAVDHLRHRISRIGRRTANPGLDLTVESSMARDRRWG